MGLLRPGRQPIRLWLTPVVSNRLIRPTLLGHIREMKMVNSIMSVKRKENPLTLTVIATSMRKRPMVQKIGRSTVHEGPVRGHEGDG